MTQQYLAGELSLLLGQLQATTNDNTATTQVAQLRHRAETSPLTTLPVVAAQALDVADDMCWDSLSHADTTAFANQATASADLWEFSVNADLLDP